MVIVRVPRENVAKRPQIWRLLKCSLRSSGNGMMKTML
jgi:hypothetical protein